MRGGGWRSAVAGGLALAATGGFAAIALEARPLETWLLRELGVIWAWQLLLALACGSFGGWLVERVLGLGSLPPLERLAQALALGFLSFGVGMTAGGLVGAYGPVFAVLLPLAMLGVGAPTALGALQRWRERTRNGTSLSPTALLATLGGTLALGILYLGLLSPIAVNYDASWNHLAIAQDYAREGRIVPFLADWMKNVPHLGSVVNTWAFLVPGLGSEPAVRWMMALHDEFTVLGFTLVGVAAGVRFLAERDVRGGWASLFLFPGIFVYDGNLGASADHFAALFAVPVLLAFARWRETPDARRAVLLGVLAGGALLAKLHTVYLLIPIAGVAAADVLRAPRARWRSAALVAGVAIGVAALHFGKNLAFYGNPFYPLAQAWFGGTPTVPGAALHFDLLNADWHFLPSDHPGHRVLDALRHSVAFSFAPRYWFAWDHPTFGSLFTLLAPLLLVLGRAPRLWLGVGIGWGAVLTWAATFPIDRNLQVVAPVLAAATGALLVRGFALGGWARAGLGVLVAFQVAWGADYFFSGADRIGSALALVQSGANGTADARYREFRREYVELGRSLPEDAVVMLHVQHPMLGIDRPVLLDWAGFQGLIDYRPLTSARSLGDRLRELGVTHVVWVPDGPPAPSKQADVVFAAFVAERARETRRFGALRVAPVGGPRGDTAAPLRVVAFGLPGYEDGLFDVDALAALETMPPEHRAYGQPTTPAHGWSSAVDLARGADAVVLGGSATAAAGTLPDGFEEAARWGSHALYLRRR